MLATHLAKGDGQTRPRTTRGLKEVTDDTVEFQSEAPFDEPSSQHLGEGRGSRAAARGLLLSGGTRAGEPGPAPEGPREVRGAV